MEHAPAMLNTLLGFDNKIVAITIMLVTYIFLFSEKFNRATVALLGAGAMFLFGVVNQKLALASIDFNTLNLLIGMMIIVGVTEETGVFQFAGLWAVKKVNANPRGILVVMTVLTAFLSGYIGNVTTVLLITPIVIQIASTLEIRAFPFLMMVIFACNIGGAATLIGDPPNIIVASRIGLTFGDFIINLAPISYFLVLVLIIAFDFIWGRKMYATPAKKEEVMQMCAKCHITDMKLLKKCLVVLALAITALIFAHDIGLETGTIAIISAAATMLVYTFNDEHEVEEEKIKKVFCNIDWVTIFFFVGLFVVVGGMEHTGVLNIIGHYFAEWADGSVTVMMMSFMWAGGLISVFIDNIPFVITMIPIVEGIEETMNLGNDFRPIWWAVLMGACYGGNGTIIAASPNIIVAGIAAKSRRRIGFLEFMKWGLPVTFVSILISSIYVYLFYLR